MLIDIQFNINNSLILLSSKFDHIQNSLLVLQIRYIQNSNAISLCNSFIFDGCFLFFLIYLMVVTPTPTPFVIIIIYSLIISQIKYNKKTVQCMDI